MTLAQSAIGGSVISVQVLIWVGALIVAVLILGIIILLIRRKLFTKDTDTAAGMLADLRRMHKAGELTTAEYDAARKALTARFAANVPDRPAPDRPSRDRPHAEHPQRPAAAPSDPGELRAKPGFDLTGAPLPMPPRSPGPYDRKPPTS